MLAPVRRKRMKGISDEIQLVGAVVLCCLIWVIAWPKLTEPTLDSYGDSSALFIGEMIANDIDSLSTVDSGWMVRKFPIAWDIKIEKGKRDYYVVVSHDKFSSEKKGNIPILAELDIEGTLELYDVKGIKVEKTGDVVSVSALEETDD